MSLTTKKYYPWLLVVCYSLLGFTFPAAVTQFSMVVSDLADAMELPEQTVLLADSFRAVCLVAAMFLSGFIYKKLGLKKTMGLGILFQISSQFFIPIAVLNKNLPLFFLFKGMQGLNAMAFPLYISSITTWCDARYKGLATAVFNGSFIAGGGIGAWIAGKIVPVLGWQYSFYFIGALCLLFAVPSLCITRDKQTPQAHEAGNKRCLCQVYKPIITNPLTWLLIVSLLANTWVSQAINVDMSVYALASGFSYESTGLLMLVLSVVTIVSSVLAGGISDWFAGRSRTPVHCRGRIMALGYLLAMFCSALLPLAAGNGFAAAVLAASGMAFGVSWSAGVFWAIPSEIYSIDDMVAGTAFCSGASNVPNPIAPMVVGVLLGSHGMWAMGWMTCALTCLISLAASLLIRQPRRKYRV